MPGPDREIVRALVAAFREDLDDHLDREAHLAVSAALFFVDFAELCKKTKAEEALDEAKAARGHSAIQATLAALQSIYEASGEAPDRILRRVQAQLFPPGGGTERVQ